jgi:hypothetical protein
MSDLMAAELDDLVQSGIIGFRQQTGEVARPSATLGGGDFRHVKLENLGATGLGTQLLQLMRLERIPDPDLGEVCRARRARVVPASGRRRPDRDWSKYPALHRLLTPIPAR